MTARQGQSSLQSERQQQQQLYLTSAPQQAGTLLKTSVLTPAHDNPRCDYFTAQRAAALSFTPPPKQVERSPHNSSPNGAALIAARASGTLHPPSASPASQGRLSRSSSYESSADNSSLQAAQLSVKRSSFNLSRNNSTDNTIETDTTGARSSGSVDNSSLRAAQLSVKRSIVNLSRDNSNEKIETNTTGGKPNGIADNSSLRAAQLSVERSSFMLSRNDSSNSIEPVVDSISTGIANEVAVSGSMIAAKRSAARDKSKEPTLAKPAMNNSTLAASRAVTRSNATAQPSRDQPEEEILPSKGSVLEAKKRLFQQTNDSQTSELMTSSVSSNKQTAQNTLDPTSIKRRYEAQGANGTKERVKSPTPLRIGTPPVIQQASMTAAIRAVRDSPPKSVSVLKQNTKPILSRTTSPDKDYSVRVSVLPKKPAKKPPVEAPSQKRDAKSFDGKIVPPQIFPATLQKAKTGDNTTDAAKKVTDEGTKRTQAPPPPQPRGTKANEMPQIDISNRDEGSYFPPSQLLATRATPAEASGIYQNSRVSTSSATLPVSRPNLPAVNVRSMSTQSFPSIPRNVTGPEMGSRAAALAFKNPGTGWRDDMASLSQASPQSLHASNTGDSFRHAVVASSLASSRAPSPMKTPIPPPPPRAQPGLRTTLRKPDKTEQRETSPPKKHKHLVKHPNKHHEGTRRRWREIITEKERRRYEGLWAANRGLYIPDSLTAVRPGDGDLIIDTTTRDGVCSIVVRDLWNRSRLPSEILENIWDLVDRKPKGWLSREEFIMGLWLIDQSLKGRKLPGRVQAGTWESINRLKVVLRDYKMKPQKSGGKR